MQCLFSSRTIDSTTLTPSRGKEKEEKDEERSNIRRELASIYSSDGPLLHYSALSDTINIPGSDLEKQELCSSPRL